MPWYEWRIKQSADEHFQGHCSHFCKTKGRVRRPANIKQYSEDGRQQNWRPRSDPWALSFYVAGQQEVTPTLRKPGGPSSTRCKGKGNKSGQCYLIIFKGLSAHRGQRFGAGVLNSISVFILLCHTSLRIQDLGQKVTR